MKKRIFEGERTPLLFGHRGYSSLAPENTLAAFKLCRERGIPGIELDVHLCASGELVVIHDDNLKRTAELDARVEETELSVIRTLDAGSWFGASFAGERVPLLRELFEELGSSVYYDIEIKHDDRKPIRLETSLLSLIREFKLEKRVFVSSFNPFAVKVFGRLAGGIPTATLYADSAEIPLILRHGEGRFFSRTSILKPNHRQVSRFSLFLDKTLGGFSVIPWTVDDPHDAERLLSLGVDGIISNRPEDILNLMINLN